MSKFVHLHNHSHYSLLSALPKIKELVSAAKAENMPALGLTDDGNLYGAINFYKECQKEDIKPILGLHAYIALRKRTDKQTGIDNKRSRLILLVKDKTGYKNLVKLVTASFLEGFYYKPRIDKELLEKHKEGLVCISPFFGSEIAQMALHDDYGKAVEIAKWYKNLFGEDFYLEITFHPTSQKFNEKVEFFKKLSKELEIPLVASQEVYYLKPEDKKTRSVMLSIQTNNPDYGMASMNDEEDFSFTTSKTFEKNFKDMPEALENNLKIAEKCNLELKLGEWVFPDYQSKKGKTVEQELKDLVYEGVKKRNFDLTSEAKQRLDYELEVINTKGYTPYFLVVADLLNFARENGIFSTTRGSAAGSLVSYLTFITTVDPLKYKLPFERFLNPQRPSAPDIDMDFADSRRDEVIKYAKEKYGEDKVAQIGTFGTMMARGSVRDVARAMGHPYSLGDRIAKLIPFGSQGFPMSINKAISITPELQAIYKEEKDVKEIIDTAKKIEGCARHISVHAAGVVISPTPLTDFVPLQFDPKGEEKVITQYDMHSVEDAGLLKFDFLGIKNLSILANSINLVRKIEGVEVDIENIPLDDKKTFEILAKGETIGLFQLNGSGMTKALKELAPTSIHDISAMIALYRPGPMATINDYIARKHGKQKIVYYHPKMEKFLDKTYGLLVYQDDLLFTAMELAGYDWSSVDKFRKAVGKKIPEEMAKQHKIFVEGCQEHSKMTKNEAEKIWKLFEPFQGYGFNKAHAASYGMVAYQTAYMKANFPAIYMSAVLTADSGDTEKIAESVAECKRMGIPVLPPNINESFADFTVVKNQGGDPETNKSHGLEKIRFGLTTIKNFGAGISQSIIEERKKNGKFKNLTDFISRIKDRNLNKKSLEALIKSGALDEFGERGNMLGNLDNLLLYHKEKMSEKDRNQDSLFGGADTGGISEISMERSEEATQKEKLAWERELLGLYISGHPLSQFGEDSKEKFNKIKKLKEKAREGETVIVGGIIEEVKKIMTKSGQSMVFIRIADFSDNIESVIFPRVLKEAEELVKPENCIAIKGKFSKRNGSLSLIAEKMKLIS